MLAKGPFAKEMIWVECYTSRHWKKAQKVFGDSQGRPAHQRPTAGRGFQTGPLRLQNLLLRLPWSSAPCSLVLHSFTTPASAQAALRVAESNTLADIDSGFW